MGAGCGIREGVCAFSSGVVTGGTDELAARCEQWSVTYPCFLMCEAMSQALSTPRHQYAHFFSAQTIWTEQEKAALLSAFSKQTPALTPVIKLCIVMQ